MSNEKQETISDIVSEMRKAEATWHRSEIAQLPTQYLKEWSDRIEAAHQREVAELREENARLRAALKPVLEVYISQDDNSVSVYDSRLDAAYALNAVREAKRIYNDGEERIAPLRNCDLLSKDEVLEILKDRSFSKEDTIEWLYEEAKGETK